MVDRKIIAIAVLLVTVSVLVMPLAFAGKPVKAPAQCKDGSDNDGDGYTDWPDDPGCANKNDKSELNPAIECDDGSDNDGDSNTDMDDSGCSSPTDNDETDCGDGVCEGGETSGNCPADCGTPDSCSDTDGGNYPLTFGTTSGYLNNNPYSNDDYCVDSSNVMEYYCSGDYEQSQQQSCGTDGYVGDNYCSSGDVYRDYRDYFCSAGECDYSDTPYLQEECDYGCTNGTCNLIPDSCNETDGGYALFVQGETFGYFNQSYYNETDYCQDNTTLNEFYCIGNYAYDNTYNCAMNYTGCSSGACY